MAKTVVHYLCKSCGGVQTQWMGKCPDCGTWDGLEKYTESRSKNQATGGLVEVWAGDSGAGSQAPRARPLPEIEALDVARHSTGVGELDRVLGGGLVTGSVVLLGGDPGIGKSTLLLQAAARMASAQRRVLYVTSEESAFQTRLRAERLFSIEDDGSSKGDASLKHLFVLADTDLTRIVEQARQVKPAVLVIDSIQMVHQPGLDAAPGSVTQVRRGCMDLVRLAKITGMSVVLVGHVTKDGQFAGPKLLEHLVDVVLAFEGDRHHAHRIVRGVKNRYGTTLEVGLFEMTGEGLAEVDDASRLRAHEGPPRPGSAVAPVMHGSRCLLVEIQALTSTGFLGNAKRRTSGLDGNRLAMLIAVLEKHGGLRLADQDVFASSVGGLKIVEPSADLALCLAIASAHYGKCVQPGTAVLGEVGLGGEVRAVTQIQSRVRECIRRGFSRIIAPAGGHGGEVEVQETASVAQTLEMLSPVRTGLGRG